MEKQPIVAHDEWTEARKALFAKEKEFTHLRDEEGKSPQYWVRRHDEYSSREASE
jgi:predicted dithiol-disulfide oxidoreductase (DUF899 family)